nr:T9SS type A sorting domain-containing protein [Bacteroidota bacterium]
THSNAHSKLKKQIIDISSLASGIYVAQIIYEGRKYEKKVLKE